MTSFVNFPIVQHYNHVNEGIAKFSLYFPYDLILSRLSNKNICFHNQNICEWFAFKINQKNTFEI